MYEKVLFHGEWADEDIRSLREVIAVAEQALSASPSQVFGKTWICVRDEAEGTGVCYLASRMGLLAILRARTAAGLARRIADLSGHSPPAVTEPVR